MRIRDEIFNTFFTGRYIILLMGAFSMYTGLIYNEFYSRSINIFGSSWKVSVTQYEAYLYLRATEESSGSGEPITLDPIYANSKSSSYPFGIDPVWNIAANTLNFTNSFKMKMSVILGITQMLFGVVLSFLNYRHFKQRIDVLCVFLPQIAFLCCIFVYLCLIIVVKWIMFSVRAGDMAVGYYPGPHCAPSLLIGLINMFMFRQGVPGFVQHADPKNTSSPFIELPTCSLNQWYPGQKVVEIIFVLIAVVCIPWMLLGKPFYLRAENKKRMAMLAGVRSKMASDEVEVTTGASKVGEMEQEEEFEFSEVLIHQAIHTIEFCLGCISHTASYLRLWALSLAHSELSEVLWTMILRNGLTLVNSYVGGVVLFFVFWAFAALTVAVLVLMEGLSAFLHALRLHWVEFQSKFYSGSGHAFAPFSFDIMLEELRQIEGQE